MAGRIFLYTLLDRNRGGAPNRGRAEISEALSTPYARIEHSRSTNELAITRYFRSKTQYVGANFSGRNNNFRRPNLKAQVSGLPTLVSGPAPAPSPPRTVALR